ncbi:hypothetical protein CPC08DRAFT_710906 [Agrocybe pediades]|nr:hypothetical protein CPC08DRAFT_710906 [Agrocybe pediades]
MAKQQLPLEARRIRMIIVSLPILVASSYVLYKRVVYGEEQRRLPKVGEDGSVRLLDPRPSPSSTSEEQK